MSNLCHFTVCHALNIETAPRGKRVQDKAIPIIPYSSLLYTFIRSGLDPLYHRALQPLLEEPLFPGQACIHEHPPRNLASLWGERNLALLVYSATLSITSGAGLIQSYKNDRIVSSLRQACGPVSPQHFASKDVHQYQVAQLPSRESSSQIGTRIVGRNLPMFISGFQLKSLVGGRLPEEK